MNNRLSPHTLPQKKWSTKHTPRVEVSAFVMTHALKSDSVYASRYWRNIHHRCRIHVRIWYRKNQYARYSILSVHLIVPPCLQTVINRHQPSYKPSSSSLRLPFLSHSFSPPQIHLGTNQHTSILELWISTQSWTNHCRERRTRKGFPPQMQPEICTKTNLHVCK